MKLINVLKTFLVLCLMVSFMVSCEEKAPETISVTSVTVSPERDTLKVGESLVLQVSVFPENATNKKYRFSVDKDGIVEISGDTVIAKAAGKAVVTVITEDQAKTTPCTIVVKGDNNNNNNNNSIPVIDSTLNFTLEVKEVSESDIVVNVTSPKNGLTYWLWCVEKKRLESDNETGIKSEEEIMAMDQENIKSLIPLFANEAAADGTSASAGYIIKMLLLQGSQEVSIAEHFRALIDKGFMEIKPGTEYVIYAYAMNAMGYPMSRLSATACLTEGEAPNNGDDDQGENPGGGDSGEGEEEYDLVTSDFKVKAVDSTSSSITLTVAPTSNSKYIATVMSSASFEPGGFNYDVSDADVVFEWYSTASDISKFEHTGTETITFSTNLKADTRYTVLLFRAYASGQLNGNLVKFEMTTLPEEATE